MTIQKETSNNRPLRILIMGSTAYRGGVTTAITTLCTALHQEGHEVMLISDGGNLDTLLADGVHCVVTDFFPRIFSVLRGTLAVKKAIRQFRPDIIHVNGRAPALLCYLSGRIPDWFTLHNTHFTGQIGAMDVGLLRRTLSPTGRRFFVLDEIAKTYLYQTMGINPSKIEVISNGVDCDHYRQPTQDERQKARDQFKISDNQTFVLLIGRLHPSKQPLALIAAAKAARASGLNTIRFAIVGDGELEEQVRREIDIAGVQDICKLYGWMDPIEAYFAADLLVMPSLYEGFGLVALEALATGLPVLRSRTGGAEKMIVEGKNGFCCGTDINDFVNILMPILKNPDQLIPMRTYARAFVVEHLSSKAQAKMLLQHYRAHMSEKK